MPNINVKVEDMSCGHCVSAITQALEAVPGVTGINADLETKLVSVTTGGDVNPGAVADAIREAGYTPEIQD